MGTHQRKLFLGESVGKARLAMGECGVEARFLRGRTGLRRDDLKMRRDDEDEAERQSVTNQRQ